MAADREQLIGVVDRFDDLLHAAKGVPFTDAVRVPYTTAYALLDEGRPLAVTTRSSRELIEAWDALDDFVHDAKFVPLTGQLRFDRETVYAMLDRIRAAATSSWDDEQEP